VIEFAAVGQRALDDFIPSLPEALRAEAASLADLEARLHEGLARARQAHPALELSDGALLAHVATRVTPRAPLAETLAALHWGDLALACACLSGDRGAIAVLEATHLAALAPALGRLGASADQIDEGLQVLRRNLLVQRETRPPEIADYAGRGPLGGWLRVMAVRLVRSSIVKARREGQRASPAALVDLFCDEPEAGSLLHARTARQELHAALGQAIEALEPRDKNVLRYHLIDRLSIDEIGAIYRVHRATAARWLTRLRETIAEGTRERLMARMRLGPSEAESVIREVKSQVDLTFERVLRDG
jgi:RNA polymerase sigma-70 factor, ECF subfamily